MSQTSGLSPISETPPASTLHPLGTGQPSCPPSPAPCPSALSSLWALQTRPVSLDPKELQGRVRLRARDTVRVLVCIESLCHRHM